MRSLRRLPGPLVVWIVSYAFFLLTLANNLSASHDSIHYLLDILNGKELFHQHHLLYNYLATRWLDLFPSSVAPQFAIESFTALWGSSTLALIYAFFRNRFFVPVRDAAWGVAIIGFSYGMWFYSVNIEVYMPPLFFLIAALYFLTRKELSLDDIWRVALLHSGAILFHQVNVLFAFVAMFVILVNRRRLPFAHAVAQYCLICLFVAGGIYFVAGWIWEGHHSLVDYTRWAAGYAIGHGYWQPPGLHTPLHVAMGFSHAFIGGHFVFQIPQLAHILQRSFDAHGLTDEAFLSAQLPTAAAWTLLALSLLFAAALIAFCLRFLKKFRTILHESGEVVLPLVLTIVVYSAFFCFWMPEILEFWIPQMVMVWMLLVGMASVTKLPFRIPRRFGLPALAALLLAINFFGSIRWLHNIDNDWYYDKVKMIRGQVGNNDLVVVNNEWILKDYIRYYTGATVLASDEPEFNKEVEDRMIREAVARKGKVYIYRDGAFIRSY